MSDRSRQLAADADRQITELRALLSTTDEAALRRTCPGRGKLGDGTVGAVALHTTDTYLRIARFLQGCGESPHTPAGPHENGHSTETVSLTKLLERLTAGDRTPSQLAELVDEQLESVPPAGRARFCDGQRTLEQVLSGMLKHQAHQIEALRTAIAS